jgi:hypothetical protein
MIAQSNMDTPDLPSVETNDGEVDPAAIVDALEEVISDIDGFLSQWFQRLSHNADAFHTSAKPDERLRRRVQDLEQDKLRWKANQHSEEQRIHERAEQLTEAWLRLEGEQRRFLQIKDAHPSSGGHRAPAIDIASRDAVEGPDAKTDTGLAQNERIIGGEHCVIQSRTPTHCQPAAVNQSREVSVQQFQQLRREIESSRPGSGKL